MEASKLIIILLLIFLISKIISHIGMFVLLYSYCIFALLSASASISTGTNSEVRWLEIVAGKYTQAQRPSARTTCTWLITTTPLKQRGMAN